MTVAALFASPAEVEANTPVTRDRAIDVIRIVSLVAVVVGHTIMATSNCGTTSSSGATCSPPPWSSYELSLVGLETQHLKNMTPPSLLLAGPAIMMCAFAIATASSIARWAQRPRV